MSTSTKILGKHRAVLTHCLAFLAMLAAIPAMASASPGNLDPSFGKGGKVVGRQGPLVDMAKLRNGGTVVASEVAMYAYLPNGKPDRRFGANGVVTPFAPAGRKVIIDGIAVDGQDRIVLAGDAGHTADTAKAGDATNYAAIERYLPSGRLDPEFRDNGAVITDFGLPLPVRSLNFPDYAQVPTPVDVQASGVAIDSRGRIVVTGTRAANYGATKLGTVAPRAEAFAARLTPNGNQDSSFSGTGASPLPGLASIGGPALDRHDGVYFMAGQTFLESPEGPRTVVAVHLNADGDEDHEFGNGGQQVLDSRIGSEEVELARSLDRKGRLLIFSGARIARLKPGGSMDRTFGHGGIATIKRRDGEVRLGGLAPEGKGIMAVGTLISQQKAAKGKFVFRLLLARLSGDGSLDRKFGDGGVVTTDFGKKTAPEGNAVLLDSGRALAGGTARYGPRSPFRFVLARYLMGG